MPFKPLSREVLLARGCCCKNGCKNCPYGNAPKQDVSEQTSNRDGADLDD